MARRRLVGYYAVAVLGTIAVYTVAYRTGMALFEGESRSLLYSLEVVMQTFTTTGYGQDAPWQTPQMKLLVVSMQVTAMVLVFAALPVVVVPLLEEMLERGPPTAAEEASDHVVVCGASTRSRLLADELTERDVDHALVVGDAGTADELDGEGYTVVHGDAMKGETLARANLDDARALVADAGDEVNLSVIIAAVETVPDVPVYAIADDPDYVEYQSHAGATEVFSPRTLLGKGLATKVTTAVTADLEGAIDVGADFRIAELPVHPDSTLTGSRVAESDIESRTGANLIGAWRNGEFRTPPFADLRLDEHSNLLVVGRDEQVRRLEDLTDATARGHGRGTVVVVGTGVVGSTVTDALAESGRRATVVDIEDRPTVDVVGDATDARTLQRADVADADVVVVAVDDDITALVVTFVVRDLNPDTEIIARANDPESVTKLYRAGANYVLSLATVSGHLLASSITAAGEVLSYDNEIRLVRRSARPVAGRTLEDLRIRERTGCTPVAVQHRDGRLNLDLRDWLELKPGDALVVAGTDAAVDAFETLLEDAREA
jgi:Trk K+ transport system NAD-binding subunit